MDNPIFSEAIKLEPGAAYVIEAPVRLTADHYREIRARLCEWGELHGGVKFLLLTDGMKIARFPASVTNIHAKRRNAARYRLQNRELPQGQPSAVQAAELTHP